MRKTQKQIIALYVLYLRGGRNTKAKGVRIICRLHKEQKIQERLLPKSKYDSCVVNVGIGRQIAQLIHELHLRPKMEIGGCSRAASTESTKLLKKVTINRNMLKSSHTFNVIQSEALSLKGNQY